ncbi:MAG: hypothetical protein ACOY0T_02430 [Myxococcota bacterium]
MARPSRPPGFDMTYRPAETAFGPPMRVKIPSIIYLVLALAAVMVVLVAEKSPAGSFLYNHIVERSARGFIGARTVALMLVLGAISSLVRANMRGVRIREDGVEYRDVMPFGLPKLRRYRWAQIDRVVLDLPECVAFDVWDGTRAFLPEVSDREGLSAALEKIAAARAIPVRGGVGLDEMPESSELAEES